jgi:hypothetical protein
VSQSGHALLQVFGRGIVALFALSGVFSVASFFLFYKSIPPMVLLFLPMAGVVFFLFAKGLDKYLKAVGLEPLDKALIEPKDKPNEPNDGAAR